LSISNIYYFSSVFSLLKCSEPWSRGSEKGGRGSDGSKRMNVFAGTERDEHGMPLPRKATARQGAEAQGRGWGRNGRRGWGEGRGGVGILTN